MTNIMAIVQANQMVDGGIAVVDMHVNPNNHYNHKGYGIYLNDKWDNTLPRFIEIKIRPHSCNV